jgi:hypothetical protein
MAPGSNFLQSVKNGGISPGYSNQSNYSFITHEPDKKIPYVNYIGVTDNVGTAVTLFGTVPASIWFIVEIVKCFWPPNCLPFNLYSAGMATTGFIILSAWAYNSDLIVPEKSQKMTSIYNDIDNTRYKQVTKYGKKTFHSSMPKNVTDEVIEQLNDKPQLKVTHAIGENQISVVGENNTTIFVPEEPVTEDAVYPNDCIKLHPIASFDGMNNADPALRWPAKDPYHDVITTNATTGKAVKLVGFIKNAFMNQVAMYVDVNGKISEMEFGTHFGKWASRNIDRDGNKIITDNDWPDGSWFFTPDISCDIHEGENDVRIVAKALNPNDNIASLGNKNSLEVNIKVICGKSLGIFEADEDGHAKKSEFFNLPMRWNIDGNESKNIAFGILILL